MKRYKVIFADQETLFTDALRAALEREGDFEAMRQEKNGPDNIRDMVLKNPDAIVIHQPLPDAGLIEIIREIKRNRKKAHILFIVGEPTTALFSLAGESAGIGIMSEYSSFIEFKEALHSVSKGERYISRNVLSASTSREEPVRAEDPFTVLTPREREVLYWISPGCTNREISDKMILSEKTVKNHVCHLLRKLELADRTKAAALAWREGLPLIEEEYFQLSVHEPMVK